MEFVQVDRTTVEEGADIVTVTMNRPEKKNAMSVGLQEELLQVFQEISEIPSDRVVVLTGAGGAFSAGGDLWSGGGNTTPRSPLYGMRTTGALVTAIARTPKPVIAKVRGVAVGAGCNLAFACDMVVASDNARFSEIFAKRGLVVDAGGSWFLPRRVGLHKAKEFAFFADIVSAQDALEFGLINRVVPDAELDSFVDGWARRLALGAPNAFAITKSLLNNATSLTLEQALDAETVAQNYMFTLGDTREAVTAFTEKRDPKFKGY